MESLLPGINHNDSAYNLMQQNQMLANGMLSNMRDNAKKWQQKILDSFSKKQ